MKSMVTVYKKSIMLKGREYAIIGFGQISKKAVLVKKDSKGKFAMFNGKKVRL